MNAASISRKLRALGFAPVAPSDRMREGLKCRESALDRVRVVADLDSERDAIALAREARLALIDAGYSVEHCSPAAFYVSR